jgi:hypothetical protein
MSGKIGIFRGKSFKKMFPKEIPRKIPRKITFRGKRMYEKSAPDWANFRPFGVRLLCAVVWKLQK